LQLLAIVSSCNQAVEQRQNQLFIYQDDEAGQLAISNSDNLITIFNYGKELYKPSFFPVNNLNGIRIDRGWPTDPQPGDPVDHPHQKGMWFNFGDVNQIDFWNNSDSIPLSERCRYGRIILDSLQVLDILNDTLSFKTWCSWLDCENNCLIKEETNHLFSFKPDSWELIRSTSLVADTEIILKDNKEGLFAIRLAKEFQSDYGKKEWYLDENLNIYPEKRSLDEGKNGYFRTSSGNNGNKAWGTSNAWICSDAVKDNDSISVLIMDHPANAFHPPHWHARDYGLFSVDNFGRQAFMPELEALEYILEKNMSLELKHGIIIKSKGFLSDNEIIKYYDNFKKLE
jgi:hypothetical protein